MTGRYYFDTCIWRDFYEDRFGPHGRPLGRYAGKLFMLIIKNSDSLFFSDLLVKELKIDYGEKEINDMLTLLFMSKILKKAEISEEDCKEAKKLASERKLPISDALHALVARRLGAVLISQDNHFQELKDIVTVKRPEQIV